MKLAKVSIRLFQVLAAALTQATMSATLFAAEIDAAAIVKCQAMQDDAARLACYDDLNSTTPSVGQPNPVAPSPAEPVAKDLAPVKPGPEMPADSDSAVAAEKPAVLEPKPLDDEIGQETLRGGDKKAKPVVRGRVVRCQQDLRKKYLFYFDNGQIWKQKDNVRIRWRECAFDVTISEDVFGYKMVPDGEKKQVRIARVK